MDADILCKECDNQRLSILERYASNTIYSDKPIVPCQEYEGDAIHLPYKRFSQLDYTQIKLFFLSILWKANITKNSFFGEVDLGPKYAEKIREMPLVHNAGKEDEFEVVLVGIDTDNTRPSQSIIEPRKLTENGNTSYVFFINQIMYHFNISQFNKDSSYQKGLIKKDGILDIGLLSGDFARGYFDNYLGKRILMKGNIKR
jgi:hypothetical protein